ncbi:uncharacterized protein LOC131956509 isoform X1 [Physella acuta]|uniref:uncharacterized protein LOC131956509 isoform X1 n=1 Tax=Physella acuta TaxID=109671 RepID=UPI0027DBB40E|nr:uncharacterized protein LOC131956509 isoform X1 [Physella acuta]
MFDCAVGDTMYTVQSPYGSNQSDFECQVGDTKVDGSKGACPSNLKEVPSDFQCQAKVITSDFQCQVKNVAGDGLTEGQGEFISTEQMQPLLRESTRPANKARSGPKTGETRAEVKTSNSASQCTILTSNPSADFQCQAGRSCCQGEEDVPEVAPSSSADFQCQVGVAQFDFQCQFNDNVLA